MTEKRRRRPNSDPPSATRRSARWPEDLPMLQARFGEYRAWLADHRDPDPSSRARVAEGLALVDELIRRLPGPYGPPRGDVLVWSEGNDVVACGALREQEPGIGEIRRIFVRADYRGGEFGRPFVEALIARARELGFQEIRADVLPSMSGAIEFYEALGFRRSRASWPHPVAEAVFFEREVVPSTEAPGARVSKRQRSP